MNKRWLVLGCLCGLGVVLGCGSTAEPAAAGDDVPGADTAADTATGDSAGADDAGGDALPLDCSTVPAAACTSGTQFLANNGVALQTFPDDWYTVADPASATGLRVHFAADNAPWVATTPGAFASTYTDLSTLDGWGVSAGVILRFSAPVMELPARVTDTASVPIALWDLDATPPKQVPFETQYTDEGTTLMLWPMVPLVPKHLHGIVAGAALKDKAGGCVAPSATLRELVAAQAPTCASADVTRLRPKYAKLLAASGVAAGDVTAAVVFTTQSTTDESQAVAADIAKRNFVWKQAPVCKNLPLYRECNGTFELIEYTDGRVLRPIAEAHMAGELPVRVWLPLATTDTTKPTYLPVIFGHGLGSDRGQGDALADRAAPLNMATIAVDAVGHGEHPGNDPALADQKITKIMAFFGVDINELTLDGLALRDHWRASTYDKLQVIRLLQAHGDIDGDGKNDLDMTHLTYLGVSLGGIMGPELLALSPDIHLAVLAVPGGRISSIIQDGSIFSVVATIMQNALNVTEGDVQRFYPVLQTLVDRGDSASYGPHILKNRLPGAGAQGTNVLAQMVIADEYVPNASNRALLRALDIPMIGEVFQDVGLLGPAPATPYKANIAPSVTAGAQQFDRITKNAGQKPVKAEHGNEPACQEALMQDLHFIQTWRDTGVAEILNPYEVMGTPKVPPEP